MVMVMVLSGAFGTARAETAIVLGRAEDAASFSSGWNSEREGSVLILQKCSDRVRSDARSVLAQAGLTEVSFLNFANVKENKLSETVLQRNWAKETNTAQIASFLRRQKVDCLTFYSEQKVIHGFLASYMQQCAEAAWNPDIRLKKQKTDEYIWRVPEIRDGSTGRTVPWSGSDWESSLLKAYGAKKEPDLELPPETEDGFLKEGETVLWNDEEGVWAYVSDKLRIVITRYEIRGLSWFEADIRRKPGGDFLHVVQSTNGREMSPDRIALDNQLVLGINTDYYAYRINNHMLVGLIIRERQILRDFHQETSGTSIPPLDTLMLNEEGMFRLDRAGLQNGESALAAGARDVLAFGPILVKDGRIRMLLTKYRTQLEPRTAIGQIEPNHFLIVVVEGRLKSSKGISMDNLRKLMYLRGCKDAINLDGGHTSVLLFMGKRLNTIGSLTGKGTSAPRNMSELLGIGTSSQVREVQ